MSDFIDDVSSLQKFENLNWELQFCKPPLAWFLDPYFHFLASTHTRTQSLGTNEQLLKGFKNHTQEWLLWKQKWLHRDIESRGYWNKGGEGYCWNKVLHRHFLRIKMQHWNKCPTSLLYNFVSFWSTFRTPSQREACKKLKLPKVCKRCLNLSVLICFTHWWNHLCETGWLGVSKDIKGILNAYKN